MTVLSSELLALLAETARDFIAEPCSSLDTNINRTLASIGRLFDADRAYVFKICQVQDVVRNTHEWCAPGVEPQIDNLQALPTDLFPWWMRELRLVGLSTSPASTTCHRRGRACARCSRPSTSTRCWCCRWSEEEMAVLRIVVSSFAQGFERRLIDARLERMAYEDSLTGLPNRALLGQRLEEALATARHSGRLLAVGYLDLDAFKRINDSYGEWLPLIEDDPAILALGDWVMEQALHWGTPWLRAGLCDGISVNVSARELLDPDFSTRLSAHLRSHPQLPAGALRLEVLESAALRDLQQVNVTMQACCDAGVSFALDDFGTGYSSLSYLRQLPVSVIKIDRSFVQQMLTEANDALIVRAVIDLAHAFGLRCVAEGVETSDHQETLRAMGCDFVQGFGIARPMPAEAFPAWVNSYPGFRPAAGG